MFAIYIYSNEFRIVEKLASLLLPVKGQIINKDRFYKEFGEEKDEEDKKENKKSYKPEDYEAVFAGNTDDSFRIGISVAKRTLKVRKAAFNFAELQLMIPTLKSLVVCWILQGRYSYRISAGSTNATC